MKKFKNHDVENLKKKPWRHFCDSVKSEQEWIHNLIHLGELSEVTQQSPASIIGKRLLAI